MLLLSEMESLTRKIPRPVTQVSVVIPALNEATAIVETIGTCRAVLRDYGVSVKTRLELAALCGICG
ncbi:MAG: hypothetical protein LBM00_01855 [Deltaproteobacteria bacterium]|jgi:hypothetical protein|nr:hypothetical protein [Deltaproteobacteria bacterium]